jgi:hypothetical protein
MMRNARPVAALLAMMTCSTCGLWADAGEIPAFPGAEGFGAASVGGRGGRAVRVTNLNASGPGSLQAACEAKGPRIVVFDVSGVIHGNVAIKEPNITIAGQTAPGAGITIEGMLKNPFRIEPNLHDVTIRFLRVRPPASDRKWSGGDCLQLTDIDRLIVDHVSCSWGSDENVDLCNSRQITVQWCAIEESDTAGHSEGQHNFGMIMGYAGRDATLHHNLFAHHQKRAPLCGLELLDHRNNVIYNMRLPLIWHPTRMNQQRPDQPFRANLVGNYFKAGPEVEIVADFHELDRLMWKPPWVHLYAQDNYFAWAGKTAGAAGCVKAEKPWPAPAVTTHDAREAYRLVLAHAGCLPRDAVGRRTVEEVRRAGGRWGRREPEGGLMAHLQPGRPPADSDGDGMPDVWERRHGLDPGDTADARRIVLAGASQRDRHAGYTYLEFYVNELADSLMAEAIARREAP